MCSRWLVVLLHPPTSLGFRSRGLRSKFAHALFDKPSLCRPRRRRRGYPASPRQPRVRLKTGSGTHTGKGTGAKRVQAVKGHMSFIGNVRLAGGSRRENGLVASLPESSLLRQRWHPKFPDPTHSECAVSGSFLLPQPRKRVTEESHRPGVGQHSEKPLPFSAQLFLALNGSAPTIPTGSAPHLGRCQLLLKGGEHHPIRREEMTQKSCQPIQKPNPKISFGDFPLNNSRKGTP
jgi:hypothetical protein